MGADEGGSASGGLSGLLSAVHVAPAALYPALLCCAALSASTFALPFLLTPAESFSRRAIVMLSALLCGCGGVLLSSAVLVELAEALSLSASAGHSPFAALLAFVMGLLSVAAFERALLFVGGVYVRRQRLREAEREEEAAALRHFDHADGDGRGRPPSAEAAAVGGGPAAAAAVTAASSSRSHRGRRDAPNPLLPPPVTKDYRAKLPLDASQRRRR